MDHRNTLVGSRQQAVSVYLEVYSLRKHVSPNRAKAKNIQNWIQFLSAKKFHLPQFTYSWNKYPDPPVNTIKEKNEMRDNTLSSLFRAQIRKKFNRISVFVMKQFIHNTLLKVSSLTSQFTRAKKKALGLGYTGRGGKFFLSQKFINPGRSSKGLNRRSSRG